MDVAQRLREARTNLNLTLEEAGDRCGIAASVLSEFEKGKREPRLAQLKELADIYHCSVASLLEDTAISNQTVLWRERPSSPTAEELEATLVDLATRYRTLELLCGLQPAIELPFVTDLRSNFDYRAAARLARRTRSILGLGQRPGQVLLRVLEQTCNVKIFNLPFEPERCAACSLSDLFGAAVLLNSNSMRWTRNFDLAHELFHLLTWKRFRHPGTPQTEVAPHEEEKLATCFACNLLMPDEVFREAVDARRAQAEKLTFDSLFGIAREFDVPIEAVVWQTAFVFKIDEETILQATGKLKSLASTWDCRTSDGPPVRPIRFEALCNQAIRHGLISTGRYAESLGISRREAMKRIEQNPVADVEIEIARC